jgi:hypothetical protein
MIAYPKKLCGHAGCRSLGTHGRFGASQFAARYCESHVPQVNSTSSSDYVDVVQKPCSECNFLEVLRNGICSTCDPTARRVYVHAKENRVRDVFDARGLVYFSRDKVVDGGVCDRYRPDFLFDAGTHFVVVEVDENQHMSYAEACERNRMLSVWQSLGMRTVFLRYNPDAYEPAASGASKKRPRPREREDVLCSWVSHLLMPSGDPLHRGNCCEALYLFYDGYDEVGAAPVPLAKLEGEM